VIAIIYEPCKLEEQHKNIPNTVLNLGQLFSAYIFKRKSIEGALQQAVFKKSFA